MVSVHDLQALEAGLAHGTAVDLAGPAAPPSGELVALLAQGAHTSPAAIMLTDARLDEPGPVIRYVNPACEALTGYTAAGEVCAPCANRATSSPDGGAAVPARSTAVP